MNFDNYLFHVVFLVTQVLEILEYRPLFFCNNDYFAGIIFLLFKW